MRIAHITSWLSSAGGGVATAVQELSRVQEELGAEVRVFGLTDLKWESKDKYVWQGAEAVACKTFGPRQLGYAPQLSTEIFRFRPDVIHCHGIWMMHSYSAARAQRCLLYTSPSPRD